MRKLVSITMLLLLLGLPIAGPLLAAMSCCPQPCDSTFRPAGSCCQASALPGGTAPARTAISPELAAPEMAGLLPDPDMALLEASVAAVSHPSHTVFLATPLRI